jgi:type III secretion protein D
MNAQTDLMQSSQLVLRVISGRQEGAEYRLSPRIKVRIGHNFDHDIVLRNTQNKDASLELAVNDDVAILTVLVGNISVLGRQLNAGESIPCPLFVPVEIGSAIFAIGHANSERWDDAANIAAATSAQSAPEHSADNRDDNGDLILPQSVPATHQIDGAIRHFSSSFRPIGEAIAIERRWPTYAVVVASLALAAVLFSPISNWIDQQANGPEATEQMLARVGFPDLQVTETAGGALLVSGVLRDDVQLQRLRRLIDDKHPGTLLDVNTMQALAAAVTDMLVAQNIDAVAKPGRGRNIVVTSEYLPSDRQTELAAQIRGDMPAIARVMFQNDANRGEPDLQYFFASEKYGLASMVDGDPAYITTADGTKWFKGALVPTGHLITGIGNGAVQFERDGQIEELRIAAPEEVAAATAKSPADNMAGNQSEKTIAERKKL